MNLTIQNLEDRIDSGMTNIRKFVKDTITEKAELITNPKKICNEMIELGKKEGLPFMVYAIAVEITEDVVVPAVLAYTGNSEYIPIVLFGHSEPVMYLLYFGARGLYRYMKNGK